MPATILHDNGRLRVFFDRRRLTPNLGPVFCRLIERQVLARPITTVLRNGNRLADDDQLILRELHRTHHPRVSIDHHNVVFQNLFGVSRTELAVDQRITRGLGFFAEYLRHLVFLVGGKARRGALRRL